MAKAIDAEKAIEIIEEKQKELCPVGRYGRNYVYGSDREKYDAWEEIIDALDNLPTLIPPNEWVSVEERLPEDSECWRTYIVTVNRSHWPTSSYDICDAPYDEQLVASAQYDSKQKIWHLPWDEQLNALIQADDAPLNGGFVTHWMSLPEPPDRRPPEGENA